MRRHRVAPLLLILRDLSRLGRLAWMVAVLVLPARGEAQAAIRHVWAVGDGDKVAHDQSGHPMRNANSHWDGKRIRLVAARNEVVAFQVIVESGAAGIAALTAALPALHRQGGTERITYMPPAADPSLSVGRPIQLFIVRDMRVERETRASWAWASASAAAPARTVGWHPVQLVPENARAGRGGFPVQVPAGQSQALWFEVYTGRDLPPGAYTGSIRILADREERSVPVELTLLDFSLPDENSLPVMVYFEPEQVTRYHGRPLTDAYHRVAHRHRVELVHAYNEKGIRDHIDRFDGRAFSTPAGYEGPGAGTGNRLVPATFYGVGPGWRVREGMWQRADAWMTLLANTLPRARTFLYIADEPSPGEYAEVRRLAEMLRANPGPGRSLPILLTAPVIDELAGLVDIWCMPPQRVNLGAARAEQANGRQLCTYNGGRPQGPALTLDAPATEARVVAWAAFKHDIGLYFYWHATHWWHNAQRQGERQQNVWANPVTFDNRGQPNKPVEDQGFLNGDGVLMYPGEDVLHPEEDRGLAGPIATVQLANLRRGIQDHLYLTMARQLGLQAAVDSALAALVPAVFSDAGASVGFAESGDRFEEVRRALGVQIAAALRDRRN